MLALIGALLLAIAFILHLVGHSAGKLVEDFALAGLTLGVLHLAIGAYLPWVRPRP